VVRAVSIWDFVQNGPDDGDCPGPVKEAMPKGGPNLPTNWTTHVRSSLARDRRVADSAEYGDWTAAPETL